MSIIKTIKSWFKELDLEDIESMKQETHTPEYEPPVVIPGVRGSPRMKYRR